MIQKLRTADSLEDATQGIDWSDFSAKGCDCLLQPDPQGVLPLTGARRAVRPSTLGHAPMVDKGVNHK